jgi:phage-related holin
MNLLLVLLILIIINAYLDTLLNKNNEQNDKKPKDKK